MIKWNDSWSIGVPEIDAQHEELVRLFNALDQDVANGEPVENLMSDIDFIVQHESDHFDYEEHVMCRCDYPDRCAHAVLHLSFMARQLGLLTVAKRGDSDATFQVIANLEWWLVNHVLVEDQKIGEWLKQHPLPNDQGSVPVTCE